MEPHAVRRDRALDLGAPKSIVAQVKNYDFKTQGAAFPRGDVITFEFAAKGKRGPVTVNWFSGEERVPLPADLKPGQYVLTIEAARETGGREMVQVPITVPGKGGTASGKSELGTITVR